MMGRVWVAVVLLCLLGRLQELPTTQAASVLLKPLPLMDQNAMQVLRALRDHDEGEGVEMRSLSISSPPEGEKIEDATVLRDHDEGEAVEMRSSSLLSNPPEGEKIEDAAVLVLPSSLGTRKRYRPKKDVYGDAKTKTKSRVRYFTVRRKETKGQQGIKPSHFAHFAPSSVKVKDSTTIQTTRSMMNTSSGDILQVTSDGNPGEPTTTTTTTTGDHRLSHHDSSDSLLTHPPFTSPHHHHHHLSPPSAGPDKKTLNKSTKRKQRKHSEALKSDGFLTSALKKERARRRREVREEEEEEEEEDGRKEVATSRQFIQGIQSIITDPGVILAIVAFNVWFAWAAFSGFLFDPISFLNSFGTGAPGGGGGGGGGGGIVGGGSSSSAPVFALAAPVAVVLGDEGSPSLPGLSLADDTPSGVPDPTNDEGTLPIPDNPVLGPVSIVPSDPAPDLVEDPAQDLVEDPAEDPVKDPVEDSAQDLVENPAQDPVEDPPQDPADDPAPPENPPEATEDTVDPASEEANLTGDLSGLEETQPSEVLNDPSLGGPNPTNPNNPVLGPVGIVSSDPVQDLVEDTVEVLSDGSPFITQGGDPDLPTPFFASLRPSSTAGTTEEAQLAVDNAVWEILANISSSITTTESTDGENNPPFLPPLPVPSGDQDGTSFASSYSVLHSCLTLGGDVPSCVAQAAAYGQILHNKTQNSLPRPPSDDVTPSSINTIIKVHPFAQVLQSLQEGEGDVDSTLDKTPLSENDKIILGFLRTQNVSHGLVERVISQVNSIKDSFKASQVLVPWQKEEERQEEEPSPQNTKEAAPTNEEPTSLNTNQDTNLQDNKDEPQKNSEDMRSNTEVLQDTQGPQMNSYAPLDINMDTSYEADGVKETDTVPFVEMELHGGFIVKDKPDEGKKEEEEENTDEKDEKVMINEALENNNNSVDMKIEVNGDEINEEMKEEEIRSSTDRRGLLIRSKYPHALIMPNKPIPFHLNS